MTFDQEEFEKNYTWMKENNWAAVASNMYYHENCRQVFFFKMGEGLSDAIIMHTVKCE